MSTQQATTTITVKSLWSDYNTAFKAEEKSINKTTVAIDAIAKTGLTVSEFFAKLWVEGVKVPAMWPRNAEGKPLSPTSKATKDVLPNVKRLVSAIDARKSRVAKAARLAALEAKEVEVTIVPTVEPDEESTTTTTTTAPTASAPRVDEVNIPSFDSVTLITSLQGFMMELNTGSLELSDKEADQARKAIKTLIDLAKKA